MNRTPPHAVVIGAGIGGLACAARLTAAGVPVTVYEAGPRAGGRVGGMRRDGWTLDFAVHMFSLSADGEVARALRWVGEPLHFVVRDPVARVWLGERSFPFPGRLDSPLALLRLAQGVGLLDRDPLGTLRHLFQLSRGAPELADDAPDSLRDWALRHTHNRGYHHLLNLLSILAFVLPYDRASAKEMARCFARIVRGPGIGYPLGGCLGLVEALVRGIEGRGGRIRLGRPVEGIHVEDGRVRGVVVDGRAVEADRVFCNAGIRQTVALAGAGAMGPDLAAKVAGLTDSMAGVMLRYRLDRRVIHDPALFVLPSTSPGRVCRLIREGRMEEAGAGFYVTVPTLFDAGLAPPGKQIVVAGTLAPADPGDGALGRQMLAGMEGRLRELFPGLEAAIIDRQVVDAEAVARVSGVGRSGAAVGVAQTAGQCGPARPGWLTPVSGLYAVGADTGSGAIGTELAAGSGLDATEHALRGERPR